MTLRKRTLLLSSLILAAFLVAINLIAGIVLERSFRDIEHQQALLEAAFRDDIRLIVVDSLRGAHRGRENDSDLISLVGWLAAMARDTGKPVLLTHHLRKRSQGEGEEVTLDRIRGTSAILQPARVVWALDRPDPTDPAQ